MNQPILEEEDEATLVAIDRGIKAAERPLSYRGRSPPTHAKVAYKILFTEDALVDLEIILDYIRADSPAVAERFGTSLLNHVDLLQNFPRIGVPVQRRRGVRKILHSPVRVYYRLG